MADNTNSADPALVGKPVSIGQTGSWPAKDESADVTEETSVKIGPRSSSASRTSVRESQRNSIRKQFMEDPIEPSCCERYLAGEILCPCCGFVTVIGVMLVAIGGGIAGAKLNTESDGSEVLTDPVLKLWYAQKEVRNKLCQFGQETSISATGGNMCGVGGDDKRRRLAADEVQSDAADDVSQWSRLLSEGIFADGPPRWSWFNGLSETLSLDWPTSWPPLRRLERKTQVRAQETHSVQVIYEAQGSDCPGKGCEYDKFNVLKDDYFSKIKEFETKLWGMQKFQESYCNLMYPVPDREQWSHLYDNNIPDFAVSSGTCRGPSSLNQQLYFQGQEQSMKTTLETYGSMPAKCVCGTTAGVCPVCTDATAKSTAATCLSDAIKAEITKLPSHKQQGDQYGITFKDIVAGLCRGMGMECEDFHSMDHTTELQRTALATELFTKVCTNKPNMECSISAPYTGSFCWSVAWSYTKNSGTQMGGAERNTLLGKMCDVNASEFGLKGTYFPADACEGSPPGAKLISKGSPFLRSTWSAGSPLEPNGPMDDDDIKDKLKDGWAGDLLNDYQAARAKLMEDTDGKVRPIMFASILAEAQIVQLLLHDGGLAVGSFLLVFFYMWFSTESYFLTACGMWEIIMSVPPAMGVWKIINADGMTSLQFLTIYMILGIGADDVFVLLDSWKQARFALQGQATPVQIFSVAYRRAFFAMFVTTFTTGSAFLLGVFSPIPMVSHFCVFAAIVVVFDFIWCVTFFASAICVYEKFFEGRCICCFGDVPPPGQCGGPGCCWGLVRLIWTRLPCGKSNDEARTAGGDQRFIEKFFGETIFGLVNRGKFILLAFWALMIISMAISAGVGIKKASAPPTIGKQSHDLVRFFTLFMAYWTQESKQELYVGWGLEKDFVTKYTSENPITPQIKWAGDFARAITTEAGQREVLALCTAPDTQDGLRCDSTNCLVRGYPHARECAFDAATWSNKQIKLPKDMSCESGRYCFMEWVQEYALHHTSPVLGFPIPQAQFVSTLKSSGFRDYLNKRRETHWSKQRGFDVEQSEKLTGWVIDGDNLKFAWIGFNVTYGEQPTNSEANKIFEDWDDLVDKYAKNTKGHKTAAIFKFMVTQNELMLAAVQGIMTSLAIAFVVLVLVTQNIIIGTIGLANITFITVTFMGLIPILGWELGTNECIFLIAVVGLSVDYSVHMLHAYNEHEGNREDKLRLALSTMGISVFSGALTTLMAATPLAMCNMKFFEQYGFFIFFVCLFSFILAIGLLPPLLLIFGPQDDCGNICCCLKGDPERENTLMDKE